VRLLGSRKQFLAGFLCGAIFIAVGGAAALWWKSGAKRSAEDDVIYDRCLATQSGNTVACDAQLRVIVHDRAVLQALEERHVADLAALKEDVNRLLAAGFSKCEITKWAKDKKDFIGSRVSGDDLASAMGISFGDMMSNWMRLVEGKGCRP
jgi:hypothetical protein